MKLLVMPCFLVMKWVFLIYIFNNNNLDNKLDEDDPDTIALLRLLTWHIKSEKRKAIPTALHPKRWWNFCMLEDGKKEIEPIFTKYCF